MKINVETSFWDGNSSKTVGVEKSLAENIMVYKEGDIFKIDIKMVDLLVCLSSVHLSKTCLNILTVEFSYPGPKHDGVGIKTITKIFFIAETEEESKYLGYDYFSMVYPEKRTLLFIPPASKNSKKIASWIKKEGFKNDA